MDLTEADYESVRRAGIALREQGWRQAFTLNEMLNAWAALVREVERGYDQMVDEYTNDLSCRNWLAAAWPMLTERIRSHRQAELDLLDERFRAATLNDVDMRLGRFINYSALDGWWWRRLPAIRRGDFEADLGSDGTADALQAVLAGSVSALRALETVSHDHLAAVAASLDERFVVTRDAVVIVLRALVAESESLERIHDWAWFVKRGATKTATAPHFPLDIEYEAAWEPGINDAVARLTEIGDLIDGEITAEEAQDLLRDLDSHDS